MSGTVQLVFHIGLEKNVADFMVYTDSVPGIGEYVDVSMDGVDKHCIVDDRQWKYKVIGSQVVSPVCYLYLQERK